MRQADYRATHLVKAVKGKELGNAYEWVEINGKNVKIVNGNRDEAIKWFAEWAAKTIQAILGNQTAVLVPIPNGATIVQSSADFRTALIAEAIAERLPNSIAAPLLRWRAPRPKSTDVASREAAMLYPELAWIAKLPIGNVVLIDDVYTTGGHATAAAWRVEDCDQKASILISCGRTFHHQIDDPLEVEPEDLMIPNKR